MCSFFVQVKKTAAKAPVGFPNFNNLKDSSSNLPLTHGILLVQVWNFGLNQY